MLCSITWSVLPHLLNGLHCKDWTTMTCDGLLEGIPLPVVDTSICPTCVGVSICSPKHNTQHCALLLLLAKYSSLGCESTACGEGVESKGAGEQRTLG